MENRKISMPVNSLSYSAMIQLLRNPLIFKLKYILGIYDGKMSVSSVIGKAGHEALRAYYGGNPDIPIVCDQGTAIEVGLKYIDQIDDVVIEYGKTGSREELLKGYANAMQFYFAEEPKYHKVLMCEEKIDGQIKTLEGDILPIPASGIPDLVHERADGKIEIIDYKFVKSFTNYDDEDYIKIIQAQFMFHLLIAAKGIRAERMLFREIKRTANRDGSPQVRDYVIPFNHDAYRIIFYNLYKEVVKFLSNPDVIFLPNLTDQFDGQHAGLLYAQGLINADMSDVEVMHKVRDVAFVSKKFVASRLDKAENKNLLPEERVKVRLAEFGIPVEPIAVKVGQSVTQYQFKVSAGVRMSTIKKHKDDIALALQTKGEIRILAPIPGTSLVGIEVENNEKKNVFLAPKHLKKNTLSLPIGVDVNGEAMSVPLDDMPHLLIAGATGSGKSVLVQSLVSALVKQMSPANMKLLLIDPKRVELRAFAKDEHLMKKVVYEHDEAVKTLLWLVDEMENRYKILEKAEKRDIKEYNAGLKNKKGAMPYIVLVIDEFADLMIKARIEGQKRARKAYTGRSKGWLYKKAGGETKLGDIATFTKAELIEIVEQNDALDEMNRVDANAEELIVRLAQMARAVGIHMIIATQRPSTDVITGLIKANMPTRIALTTASPIDSEVILGERGAEKLSGKGDMLFMYHGNRGKVRLQGFMIK